MARNNKNTYNLEMLTSCNVEYIQDILSTLNNQFWKDVLKSFLDINYKTEIGEEQILKSPLFYNRNIKIENVFFIKHGMVKASDL